MPEQCAYHLAAIRQGDSADIVFDFCRGKDEFDIDETLSLRGELLALRRAVRVPQWLEQFLRETDGVLPEADVVFGSEDLRGNFANLRETGSLLADRILDLVHVQIPDMTGVRLRELSAAADAVEASIGGRKRVSKTIEEWRSIFICVMCQGAHGRYRDILASN